MSYQMDRGYWRDGYFYEFCQRALNKKRMGTKLSPLDYKFFFFSWLDNPDDVLDPDGVQIYPDEVEYFDKKEKELGRKISRGQRAFYSKKKETLGEGIYSEYPTTPDEAFMKILEGTYYGQIMARAREEKRVTEVPHQYGYDVNTAWDLGKNYTMVIWFWQEIGNYEIVLIDYYANKDKGLGYYVDILRDYKADKRYRYGVHCLPHDVNVEELSTGLTRKTYLETKGMSPVKVVPKLSLINGIQNVREILPFCSFDANNCYDGIVCLEEYQKIWDKRLGTYRDEPLKNEASHGADAFRTLAVHYMMKRRRNTRRQAPKSKNRILAPSAKGWS